MTKLDIGDDGAMSVGERFFLGGDAFRGRRPHQIRLQAVTHPATRTASPRDGLPARPDRRDHCGRVNQAKDQGR